MSKPIPAHLRQTYEIDTVALDAALAALDASRDDDGRDGVGDLPELPDLDGPDDTLVILPRR